MAYATTGAHASFGGRRCFGADCSFHAPQAGGATRPVTAAGTISGASMAEVTRRAGELLASLRGGPHDLVLPTGQSLGPYECERLALDVAVVRTPAGRFERGYAAVLVAAAARGR